VYCAQLQHIILIVSHGLPSCNACNASDLHLLQQQNNTGTASTNVTLVQTTAGLACPDIVHVFLFDSVCLALSVQFQWLKTPCMLQWQITQAWLHRKLLVHHLQQSTDQYPTGRVHLTIPSHQHAECHVIWLQELTCNVQMNSLLVLLAFTSHL